MYISEHLPSEKGTPKKEDSTNEIEDKPSSPFKEPMEESDKELSPLKDLSNSIKSKEILNNNKEECSPADNSKLDKDSVIGDCDAMLSDLESEGTQPEEVSRLSVVEIEYFDHSSLSYLPLASTPSYHYHIIIIIPYSFLQPTPTYP
jgi:hypothetical protein